MSRFAAKRGRGGRQGSLQLDNQLHRPVYAIVLHRLAPRSEAAARARKLPTSDTAIQVAAVIAKGTAAP